MAQRTRINLRRIWGLAIGLSPVALLVASLIIGLTAMDRPTFAGTGFMIAAGAIAILNFSLSFVRPRLFLRQNGSMDDYRHVSGLPGIGTLLVILGTIFGFGAVGTAILGLVVMPLDTGGSVWLLIAVWADESFWDS